MYIAMNRFRVIKGCEAEFEAMWRTRQSYLPGMQGFVSFHLLRGPENEDHTLYSSHTTWASQADFEAWTKSEAFRAAHAKAGDPGRKVLHLGHPQFEGFETVITELPPSSKAA
ncbi:MAG: antibiotic biosynthesis monooxygenase [Hyphomicrobiaceae bacterium]|nr:antibiotic biosynthesis monooxygenase [Hyphomicrobiaceae bacterium]